MIHTIFDMACYKMRGEIMRSYWIGLGLENQDYGRGDPLRWPRDTLY
jgi:hypothetical protein